MTKTMPKQEHGNPDQCYSERPKSSVARFSPFLSPALQLNLAPAAFVSWPPSHLLSFFRGHFTSFDKEVGAKVFPSSRSPLSRALHLIIYREGRRRRSGFPCTKKKIMRHSFVLETVDLNIRSAVVLRKHVYVPYLNETLTQSF